MPHSVYAYITADEKSRFVGYCDEIGFRVGEVAKFLILRELRVGCLPVYKEAIQNPIGKRLVKVTTHLNSNQIRNYYVEHAKSHSLSSSQALAILIRAELWRREFEEALAHPPEVISISER